MTKTWTPEQQQIIDLDSGQHLVLAPPGTGKTDILAERLSMAIKSGIDQEKIVCLTFIFRLTLYLFNSVILKFYRNHHKLGTCSENTLSILDLIYLLIFNNLDTGVKNFIKVKRLTLAQGDI